jgi:hypothetical protein
MGDADKARIYEILPLVCPQCGGKMEIIAFINEEETPFIGSSTTSVNPPHASNRVCPYTA